MRKSSFSKHSETDREFLHNAKDEDIDLSDIPEITEEQIARAVMRVEGKPVPDGANGKGVGQDAGKDSIGRLEP